MPNTASSATAAAGQKRQGTVLLLGMLLGLQPVTTDLYLPALPMLHAELGAGMTQTQLTLTALLLAFGCSQLIWGPLSDRFGRRPILLTGLTLYLLASIGCGWAASIEALVGWRALQGLGMGAAIMAARAIVRDLYTPVEGTQALSRAFTGLGVLAFLSPLLGSFLASQWGWQATMGALGAYSALVLIRVASRFDESLPQANPHALQPSNLWSTWKSIVRHPTFLAYTGTTVGSYAGLFTFLASSSFIFIELFGWSRTAYGGLLTLCAASYIGGTYLCRRLLARWGLQRTVAVAGALSLSSGVLLVLAASFSATSAWAFALPYLLFQIAHGMHMPCGQSGAVAPFPRAAGTASALNGFCMMLVAFGVGHWLGTRMDGTVWPMVIGIATAGFFAALSAWTLVQKFGDTAHLR